jgi:hypothetical protein
VTRNKTEEKNWLGFFFVLVSSIVLSYCLTASPLVDLYAIRNLKQEYQYNLLSTSATIGGFLFAGISVLISVTENKKIDIFWNENYLNNMYRAAIMGIVANIVTIVAAFSSISLVLADSFRLQMIRLEIISVIVSIVFFIWCVWDIAFIISKMK